MYVCFYFSVSSRTSPKAQRPPQSNRPVRSQNTHSQTTGNTTNQLQGDTHRPELQVTQMYKHKLSTCSMN